MLNNNKNELDWEKERLEAITSYKKDEHIRLLNQKDGNSHFELLHYSIILISQLNWEINNQYFEILKNYVNCRYILRKHVDFIKKKIVSKGKTSPRL